MLVPVLLSALVLLSCEKDDGYSLNDYWLTTGTFIATSDYFYIITDDGDKLWPSASNINASDHDDGDRVIVNYTILQDAPEDSPYTYYVKVNNTSDILTKNLYTFTAETPEAEKDSIGNDPITIVDTWFTDDYINVEFEYGGGLGIHFVSLVKDESDLTTDDGDIILELKHNDNNDPYNYKQWGIASFDLSELQVAGQESVSIYVRALDKDGNYQYNKVLLYEYGMAIELYNTDSRQLSTNKVFNDIVIK